MSAFDGWGRLLLALCILGGTLPFGLPRHRSPRIIAWLGALASLAVIGLGVCAWVTPSDAHTLWSIPPVGDLVVRYDALTAVFLVVTGLVFLPVSVFAAESLPRVRGAYTVRGYALMYFALLLSIVWILLSGDVFSFLVAWEIMSVLCYLLVMFERDGEVERPGAGYLMLAVSEAGALAALAGLLLLAAHAGSLDFAAMKATAATLGGGTRVVIFLLTFFGFGVKAGLVPVNMWLPDAYTAAPAAFVPVLAGATLNLGLYGIFRVNADLMPATSASAGLTALIVGTLSALVGILYATTSNDLKTVLAHSSIENAGIITAGLGAGFLFAADEMPILAAVAFVVALYHLVNHSMYKTLLFVGAGVVRDRAGTRDLDRLGGLIRSMPWTSAAVLAGALSIAALPPFNGFVSEWLTLQTLLRSAELASIGTKIVFALCGAALALTAALAVTCFVKFFAMGFLGMSRSPGAEQATETGALALAPMATLAVLCLLLGVLPTYVIRALDPAVRVATATSAVDALVPPFFAGSVGHDSLPPAFASEFHDIGAQVGQRVAGGPGLVIMHRGGTANPVVFAASPTYLVVVLLGLLLVLFVVVRFTAMRRRTVVRRVPWDGAIRRLLPEMTYTATGFSNPVRVIFQAIFRPTIVADTRATVAEHFRTAIVRESDTVNVVDRIALAPTRAFAMGTARVLARMHHGRLNAYLAYVLVALLAALLAFAVFASAHGGVS